ncbi:NnrS family protein [Psychrobacter okhotskensis]|uniref:NnrS family protein n=1 Tax=Psychrobacter TaxID=497 RepID=UPI0004061010|nr:MULTISPECIES: NnrS family protein [Psychrobacter]NRD69838.1 NnrS family protein [Psychrobacter okhotskensis]PKG34121.1 NnrS family protein [Psychrobacter sp. Sarcosine-3u-12]
MHSIKLPSKAPYSPHPILNLSFRLFFSAAAVFAIIMMVLWSFVFTGHTDIDAQVLNPLYWHGHEMIYGYALAVVAGFLLTAVKTWTGVMMPHGYSLLAIFACWLLARLGWLAFGLGVTIAGSSAWLLYAAALFDLLFVGSMAFVIFRAVLQVKQYKQMGILAKLALLTLGNGLCYWGIISADMSTTRVGIYLGFYLIIGLVLTIGRRVVPFFIERGLSGAGTGTITLRNSKIQDIASLAFFFAFFLADLFYPNKYLLTITALGVAVVNIIRLLGWYNRGIWQKPLLWSLYIAFLGMCLSFLLYALQPWLGYAHSIALHGLAIAGVGMMTVAMMTRVSLGHTGRSIHQPPKSVNVVYILMILVFVSRVLLPLVDMNHYLLWIMVAQSAWIACFVLFCISYLPMLARPRPDGLFG